MVINNRATAVQSVAPQQGFVIAFDPCFPTLERTEQERCPAGSVARRRVSAVQTWPQYTDLKHSGASVPRLAAKAREQGQQSVRRL